MKKAVSLLVVLIMTLVLFAGCGSKSKPADPKPSDPKTSEPAKPSEPTKPAEKEITGTELSNFMTGYSEAKGKVWEAMSKKFDEQQNLSFAMGTLGFAFADLALVAIPFFDVLTVKEGDTYKGKLLLSNIDAWKKVKGDIIEFGYDFTYKEAQSTYKVGDHEIATGKYDKKAGTLQYESFLERNGKKINRIVIEIVKNSDKSYSSQALFSGSMTDEEKAGTDLNGYLTWFEGEDIISVLTEAEATDCNFKYNSILGKKNPKPEDMASGMKIVLKSSFIKGEASYEDFE